MQANHQTSILVLRSHHGHDCFASAVLRKFAAFVLLICVGQSPNQACEQVKEPTTRLYVNYSAKPDANALLAHNFCILDPAAKVDLDVGQAKGNIYLAYVSVVEVLPDTPNALQATARGIPFLARNAEWGADVLDVTHAAWLDYVVNDLAAAALAKGFDGVFLDTLDSIERIAAEHPNKAKACHGALVALIKKLHKRFPQKRIVLNRGFDLIDEVAADINGVLIESMLQGWDPATKKYHAVKPADTQWLLVRIRKIQARKLPVFVVDYVKSNESELARKTAERIAALGCVPFITTPKLQGHTFPAEKL